MARDPTTRPVDEKRVMSFLRGCLCPRRGLVALTLLLAGVGQVLTLVDPLIFGRIVDQYALNPGGRPEAELVRGALGWLLVDAAVALAARLASALQAYCLRLLIPAFGIGVLLLGSLTRQLSRKTRTVQRQVVREGRRMAGAITESLRKIELVKSLGLTRAEIGRLSGYTKRTFDLEMAKVTKVRSLAFLQGAIINILRQSILFILLWLIFTEQEITASVREAPGSRRHMVLLIAHRPSTIPHADTIYVRERGRIVETGSHDELVEGWGLYDVMWRQQIGEREPWAIPVVAPAVPEEVPALDDALMPEV
jgi:ABC-type multidrug transport system fused ATPase/permease subunit